MIDKLIITLKHNQQYAQYVHNHKNQSIVLYMQNISLNNYSQLELIFHQTQTIITITINSNKNKNKNLL